MKAVILCGGVNARLRAISGDEPRALLPFLNRPWLEHQLRSLRDTGVDEVGVALAPEDVDAVGAEFGGGEALGIRLICRADEKPMGPGGCLRLFQDLVRADPFLLVEASSFLRPLDLASLFRSHVQRRALVTLGLAPLESPPGQVEDVLVRPDGSAAGFEIRYPQSNDVQRRKFAGVYVLSHEALNFMPSRGFVDIKEQLLSALAAADRLVATFSFREFAGAVDSPEAYLRIQQEELRRQAFTRDDYREYAPGVWVGQGSFIADDARLVGPLMIGSRVVVSENVELIGPAVLGPECHIDSNAFVRESILWPGTHVKSEERLEHSVVGSRSWQRPPHDLDQVVRLVPERRKTMRAYFADLAFRVTKRAIDVAASAVGLVICLPFFVLIGIAIKLDSPGPVFFVQRRLGRGGRGFTLLKFRTMRQDAAGMQASMRHLSDVDGPMFKMFQDPRLTRLGRFLRKKSIDELPQLFNVLVGHMSLVGPRPLVSEEMRLNPGWREIRLSVRPGVTGLWQVSGRSSTGFQDWIRHDTDYVLHASLWQDLWIMFKTMNALRARGNDAR